MNVGAGSAGSVLAYRLSEEHSVLLLEAGGEPMPFQAIPAFVLFLLNYPELDWMHQSVPQRRACGNSVHRKASLSQGKGLGGTGNLNYLLHLRGHPKDYDNWAAITGDPSWSYDGVLPYFKKSENFVGFSTDADAHGYGGPLQIELPDYVGMAKEFLWAAEELGYPNVDLNGRFTEGFDALYYPIKKGVRQAPFEAFLKPARKRKNLTIRKFAHVNRVLFRNNDNGAYGVEYDRHGKRQLAYSTKEVILSAGAMQSPKILMLSGIGPKQHLKDLGVPLRVNLPVGQNLQDHLSTYLGPFFINKPRSFLVDRDITSKSFKEWSLHGKGALTTSTVQATGIFSSSYAKARGEGDWPDVQIFLAGLSVHKTLAADAAHSFGLREDLLKKYLHHAIGKESFKLVVSNGRPIARGDIRLGGKDPWDKTVIDPKYLDDPWDFDIKVMIEGVKFAVNLVENTTAFQNLGGHFTNEKLPGCEHHWFRSDEYWECYIRQFSVTLHHVCGTAAMGPINSVHAVVDPELKVIGTKGLRVIDTSVMPTIVVSNTQAGTIMIAEKGADMILNYWKQHSKEDEKHEHYSNFANSHRTFKNENPTNGEGYGSVNDAVESLAPDHKALISDIAAPVFKLPQILSVPSQDHYTEIEGHHNPGNIGVLKNFIHEEISTQYGSESQNNFQQIQPSLTDDSVSLRFGDKIKPRNNSSVAQRNVLVHTNIPRKGNRTRMRNRNLKRPQLQESKIQFVPQVFQSQIELPPQRSVVSTNATPLRNSSKENTRQTQKITISPKRKYIIYPIEVFYRNQRSPQLIKRQSYQNIPNVVISSSPQQHFFQSLSSTHNPPDYTSIFES